MEKNSVDKNLLSRIRNAFVSAMKDKVLLPKLVVIVLDEDLLTYAITENINIQEDVYQKLVYWLMKQIDTAIDIQKDYLPAKSKKFDYPHIVWIQPTVHKNFNNNELRIKFGKAMVSAGRVFDNMSVLQLKKIWDPEDSNLYVKEAARYTTAGLKNYWEAIDRTIKYVDTILLKNPKPADRPRKPAKQYKWQKPKFNEFRSANHQYDGNYDYNDYNDYARYNDNTYFDSRRKLPTPPGRHY